METELELDRVCLTRDGFQVLKEVSVRLLEGQTCVFMGGAGSGKSSLLKAAAGLVVADSGRVLYRGKDLSKMTRAEDLAFRKRSGFAFQDAALWSNQSLFENLALPLRLHEGAMTRTQIERAVRRSVDIVGFDGDLSARPAELSSGERRLVGLARALVLDPELVFLDEPAAYLDEVMADRVYDICAQLRARDKTLLVVSGNSPFVSRSADAVGVVREGSLAAFGPYDEAVGWSDSGFGAEIGRLKPRSKGVAVEAEEKKP